MSDAGFPTSLRLGAASHSPTGRRACGLGVHHSEENAASLAKLLRAGELTAVWVPDTRHEAMRDLVRSREAAAQDQTRKRQQVTSFLLRHGRVFPRKTTWGATHARWLTEQVFDRVEQRIAFEELVMAARQATERVKRLEAAIAEFVPTWSMAPLVEALQSMRGIDLVAASILMAELGDLSRFDSPRRLMGFLGLVPSERSTGDRVRRGRIDKDGQFTSPPRADRKRLDLSAPTATAHEEKVSGRSCAPFRA